MYSLLTLIIKELIKLCVSIPSMIWLKISPSSSTSSVKKNYGIWNNSNSLCAAAKQAFQDQTKKTIIGSGSYGRVYAYKGENNYVYAAKQVEIRDVYDINRTLREIQVLKFLKNAPGVVRLRGGFILNSEVFLLLDKYDGDLRQIIRGISPNSGISEHHIQFIAAQIFLALSNIHSACIMHRDIKPANILINFKNCKVALCDFNLSKCIHAYEVHAPQTEDVVTRWYKCPELLLKKKYSYGIDIWAAGCSIIELCLGKPLWDGDNDTDQLSLIQESFDLNNEIHLPHCIQGDFLDFLKRIFQMNPLLRMNASEALEHNWLKHSVSVLMKNEEISRFSDKIMINIEKNQLDVISAYKAIGEELEEIK